MTFFVALTPLTIGSVVMDGLLQGAARPLAWYSAVVALAIVAVYFAAVGKVVNSRCPEESLKRTVAVLVVYATTEVLRTTLVGLILQRYALDFELMVHHRIVSGGLTGMLVLGLVSIVVNDRARYAADFAVLTERTRELEGELFHLTNSIEAFLENLRETIRLTVDASFASIVDKYRKQHSVAEVVEDIVDLSEHVVRPLSVEIQEAIPLTANRGQTPPRLSLPKLFHLTTTVRPFQPMAISLVTFLLMFGGSLFTVPQPGGIILLVSMIALSGGGHFLGERFVGPRLADWPALARVLIVSGIFALGPTIPMVVLVFIYEGGFSFSRFMFVVYMVAVIEFVSWALAALPAARRGQQDVLDRLSRTTSELAHTRSRAEVRLRKEKNRLAAVVHGDIQSTLMATALGLQRPDIGNEEVDQLITTAREHIAQLLKGMAELDNHRSLHDVTEGVVDAWRGVVTVTFDIGSDVAQCVAGDDDLGEVLWQVLREATTNSVKHGGATEVVISLEVSEDQDSVLCSVVDNGHRERESCHTGGGSRLFQAVAESYERVRRNGRTTLSLTIPFSPQNQAVSIPS